MAQKKLRSYQQGGASQSQPPLLVRGAKPKRALRAVRAQAHVPTRHATKTTRSTKSVPTCATTETLEHIISLHTSPTNTTETK